MTKDTQIPSLRAKRWGVAEAKSRLSEVLREAANGPTIIHSRGKDLVVVLAIEDYERLISEQQPSPEPSGASFLKRVEALKQRYGGGVSDFEPPRLDFVPAEAFSRKRTRRA